MKTNGPPRLRDDEITTRMLRLALDASADEPSDSDLAALAAGLGISLGPVHPPAPNVGSAGPVAGPVAKATLAAGGSKWLTLVIAPTLAGALAGAVVWKTAVPSRPVPSVVAPPSVSAPAPGHAATQLAPRPAEATSPVPTFLPAEPSAPPSMTIASGSVPRAPSVSRETPAAPTETAAREPAPGPMPRVPDTEVSFLERAKALVDSEPIEAFALATEHASRFPRGILQQEAEVIAIEALVRAGRATGAAEHLTRFRQRFPSSAYLPHLEGLVQRAK